MQEAASAEWLLPRTTREATLPSETLKLAQRAGKVDTAEALCRSPFKGTDVCEKYGVNFVVGQPRVPPVG